MNTPDHPPRHPIAFRSESEGEGLEVKRSMSAARLAQNRWARTPLERRLRHVRELRHLIAGQARELAEASAAARGRPVDESLTAEVLPLAEACRFAERYAQEVLAPRRHGWRGRPLWLGGVRSEIRREPFGVILVIGPGNYPLLLPGVQAVQALVAGNAVLLKPGIGGKAAAAHLRHLALQAGFAPALLALLPETTEAARAAIAARPDKVIFTGTAATGKMILTQLAQELVPATMELSGCDGALVCADADLTLTVRALAFGLRLNEGATCLSPKRVLVHRRIATELEGGLAQEFHSFSTQPELIGIPSTRAYGPNPRALERLRPLLRDALAMGAHFVAGGMRPDGSIQMPIVLAGVSPDAQLLAEDVFLPVLALVTVADEEEGVRRLNDCPFALGASIFTRDEARARELAARIDVGVISINDLIVPTADPRLPFGGRRRSGFGVTRGADGLLELTRPKVLTLTRGTFRPAWEAPQPGDAALIEQYVCLAHGRGLSRRLSALLSLARNLLTRRKSTP